MRITPLKTMLKTKVVKEFLANSEHEKVVTHEKHGYKSLEEFFLDKYKDYKVDVRMANEDGEDYGNLTSELLVYNIECDMEAMYEDVANVID